VIREKIQFKSDQETLFGEFIIPQNKKARKKAELDLRFVKIFPITHGWKQLKLVGTFNPTQSIENILCPALFTFAGNDNLVYPRWCMHALQQIFPDELPFNFTVKTFAGLNHSYRKTEFCSRGSKLEQAPYSEVFKQYLANWIINNLK